eukprot:5021895-Amphidinium_carterae.1
MTLCAMVVAPLLGQFGQQVNELTCPSWHPVCEDQEQHGPLACTFWSIQSPKPRSKTQSHDIPVLLLATAQP